MNNPKPTAINLHKMSRKLDISFDDGQDFSYSIEYLRCFSPSAEVQGHSPEEAVLQLKKEFVGIEKIEQVGNYAVCLHFDDGHHTGIYSWETLYSLGKNMESNWADYLQRLKDAGHERSENKAPV